ncbi:predicted protein [Pyrenophora tritici-repentis Pt-1C-BFP]|uniref:Secreted protein n=1 Tax=Pyrenophora tritici-repentis (strain Pt-1C-BFP) TaxID=426418 RepID=B2VSX4_PYRTR|nr:uncharacterized protein PTRG_00758 [Pyrenophora tritici-repentis Pt-1C-BFP]EDU40196.1 predicted protein [Pyrenophora tritici-repentis Pt-1C-BFP]
MLFLTLLFIDAGFPSSYSMPAAPPSLSCPCNFAMTSASSSACVFFLGFASSVVFSSDFWFTSFTAPEDFELASE